MKTRSTSRVRLRWLPYLMQCILSVLVVAVLIAALGCAEEKSPASSEPAIPAHFTTYTDKAGLFSISYPPDWKPPPILIEGLEQHMKELNTSIESGTPLPMTSLIFIAGLPTEMGYRPSVNITVDPLSGVMLTHDKMVEAQIKEIKDFVQDYHEFCRVKTTIGGREATIVDWEGAHPELGRFHILKMFTLVGKIAWVVSCTPPTGEFSKWEDDFYHIVKSLRIWR